MCRWYLCDQILALFFLVNHRTAFGHLSHGTFWLAILALCFGLRILFIWRVTQGIQCFQRLDSLDRLALACEQDRIEFILPAHGHVIGDAAQAIAQLKAHRLRREAKVLAAMRAAPHCGPNAWVSLAYDDTSEALWPLAHRSLTAHVQRIEQLAML